MRTLRWGTGWWLLCAALAAGMARGQTVQPVIGQGVAKLDTAAAQRGAFPGGVTAVTDLVYSGEPGALRPTLDLYLPPGLANQPRPLVVFIHGGGWSGGSKRNAGAFADWPLALASLAARGFVVASIDYRLAQEAAFPAALIDVKDALRWLRSMAGTYGIDRARVLVWGADAGGQLAALAAVSCGTAGLDRPETLGQRGPAPAGNQGPPPAGESACVQAAVVWYGVADFGPLATMAEANGFLACRPNQDCSPQRRLASPVTHVAQGVPPFLIIHGINDLTVPVSQARQLSDRIRAVNGSVELILLPGVGHDFLGSTPAETRDASQRAWSRTVGFIERMLRPNGR